MIELAAERGVFVSFDANIRTTLLGGRDKDYVAVLDGETGKLVKRPEVGRNNANVSFRPDRKYGYVAVTG
ncbi:MAG: hypothetical protein ACR2KW_10485 [Rubrobacter sp.]